jgi:hypothetical protein
VPTAVPTEAGDGILAQFGAAFGASNPPAPEQVANLLALLKNETVTFASRGITEDSTETTDSTAPSHTEVVSGLAALKNFVGAADGANPEVPGLVLSILSDMIDPTVLNSAVNNEEDSVGSAEDSSSDAEDAEESPLDVAAKRDAKVGSIEQEFANIRAELGRTVSKAMSSNSTTNFEIDFSGGGIGLKVKRAATSDVLGSSISTPTTGNSSGDATTASFVLPSGMTASLPARIRVMSWSGTIWPTSDTDVASDAELTSGSTSTMGGFTGSKAYGLSILAADADGDELKVANLEVPIAIKLPVDASVMASSSTEGYEHECRYFHQPTSSWKTDGCELGEVGDDYIMCMCTHLTEFASFKKLPPPTRAPTPAPPPGQIPNPVDCEVSGWSDWGACDYQCPAYGAGESQSVEPWSKGQSKRVRTVTQWDEDGGRPCPRLHDTRQCSQPITMWTTFTGHDYLFANAIANRSDLNGTFDQTVAVQMMQQAWATAAAKAFPGAPAPSSNPDAPSSLYFPCMRIVGIELLTADLSANFSELDDLIKLGLNGSSGAENVTMDGPNRTNVTLAPTVAPTPAPTPVPLLTFELEFEGMLMVEEGYGRAAFNYLDAQIRDLMLDIAVATTYTTTVASEVMVEVVTDDANSTISFESASNTSVKACCFRWGGGGICPTPVQGLMGYLADAATTPWGPFEVEEGGVISSEMQVALLELLVVQGKSAESAATPPIRMFYTLDGSTPSSSLSTALTTQADVESTLGSGLYGQKLSFRHSMYRGAPLIEPITITINCCSSRSGDDSVEDSGEESKQTWVDSDVTRVSFTLSPPPPPAFSAAAMASLTQTLSVVVGTAVGASVGTSIGASTGGGGGTGGNPLDLINQVQFMAVSGSISGVPEEYASFASGFSWMNLQFEPAAIGLPRFGEAPKSEADAALDALGDGTDDGETGVGIDVGSRRRSRVLLSGLRQYPILSGVGRRRGLVEETNSSGVDSVLATALEGGGGGMDNMLLAMGVSPDELFVCNLLAILAGGIVLSILHQLFNCWLVQRTNRKRKKVYRKALLAGEKVKEPAPYQLPRMLEFPRAEMAFGIVAMMGFCQSSLTVLSDVKALRWIKTLAVVSLSLVVGALCYALYVVHRAKKMVRFDTYGSGRVTLFVRQFELLSKFFKYLWKKLPTCCTRPLGTAWSATFGRLFLACRAGSLVCVSAMRCKKEARIYRVSPENNDAPRRQSVVKTIAVKEKSPRSVKEQTEREEQERQAKEAGLKKAAQFAGKWLRPDAEPQLPHEQPISEVERTRRQKFFDKWKWLFDKYTPHGIMYFPAFLLFKLAVCILLAVLKGQAQAWCLAIVYFFWLHFMASGQPHIAHRKVYSEFFSAFASLAAIVAPLLALYGIIPTSHLTLIMMLVNMGAIASQIIVEMATAMQAVLMVPCVRNIMPCGLGELGIEELEKIKRICEKVGGSSARVGQLIAKPLLVMTGGYSSGYLQAVSEWVSMTEEDQQEEQGEEGEEGLVLEDGYEEVTMSLLLPPSDTMEISSIEIDEEDPVVPPYLAFHGAALETAAASLRAMVMSEAMPFGDDLMDDEDIGDDAADDIGADAGADGVAEGDDAAVEEGAEEEGEEEEGEGQCSKSARTGSVGDDEPSRPSRAGRHHRRESP